MGVFKQREITGFNGFQPEFPIMSVTIQLSLAKTRPNGTFRCFIRFPTRLRTTAPGLKVGH
jgi:hypothetical protein